MGSLRTQNGALAGSGGGDSSVLRRQLSADGVTVSFDTDEEFDRAIASYDIPTVSDALRRYLASEVQAR